ncbi:MAG: PIG-L family deacetylase [Chloroflexi bacterium]|nr:PIG-L family deacetylase [Chloroflexota bacterium]
MTALRHEANPQVSQRSNTRVLVAAAHPDDEVLGCGGTIARLAQEGDEVSIAIFGEGITARYDERGKADAKLLEKLRGCSRKAAEVLGAKDLFTYGLPDNRFDTLALLDIVKIVEELIDRLKPSVVYTHHPGDLNIDHALLGRAVLTATRPVKGCPVSELYTFEIASSTEWTFQRIEPVFRPNTFVDIGDRLDAKIEAMMAYEDEMRPFPHPRSEEALRAIAARWGSVAGLERAEAFELIRSVHKVKSH